MAAVDEIIAEILAPPIKGPKRSRSAVCTIVRYLETEDIARLYSLPSLGSNAAPLQRIRHTHHMLARLLAQGVREEEASSITGYSPGYISGLKVDPAFKGLLAYYHEQSKEVFLDVQQRLAGIGVDSLEELQARLSEDPSSFTSRELMELAALGLDRSGFGPQTKHQLSGAVALITPEQIERLKRDVSSAQLGSTKALPSPPSEALLGEVGHSITLASSEAPREPGQRLDVSEESPSGTQEEVPG